MKPIVAVAAFAAAMGLLASAPQAKAESTYWQDRWEGRGYYDPEAYGPPSRYQRGGDHVDIRVRKRPRAYAYGAERFPKRSYNGPVYQSQEEVQQSVYEFSTGGFGNIKSYR